MFKQILHIVLVLFACNYLHAQPSTMLLNGTWQYGFSRIYTGEANVPGITVDPKLKTSESLWYKKQIQLPLGNWSYATLELKGARFRPTIFINGDSLAMHEGGMAPIFFALNHKDMKPGKTIQLEIALASLQNVPVTDASFIPPADQWRSNVSSTLWDDVVLHLYGNYGIDRIIPFNDYNKGVSNIEFYLRSNNNNINGKAIVDVLDGYNKVVVQQASTFNKLDNSISISYQNKLKKWSVSNPNLYKLRLRVWDNTGKLSDERIIPFGIRQFEAKDKKFYLNQQPFTARGGTVVWHRWVRTQEGRALGYDTTWFVKNIIQRLKGMGANYLRFHLGKPPEKFLDLCDQYGLVVQYEWSFFHGMPASKESLLVQYKNWLDVAAKHPSVCLIHPYNETEGDEINTVWSALNQLKPQYPPMVMEDQDVIHVHKYWWSLFENLGLYYDSAMQFPKAIMVDEFGGNYLDENGNPGAYTTVKETLLRFLGRQNTTKERLAFQAAACGKVAEYWRRIGAAGFAPFCILSSWDDGNNWFMGDLKDGKPKPVWEALAPAFAPVSVSLNIWDKNFTPSQKVSVPIQLFNETNAATILKIRLSIEDEKGNILFTKEVSEKLDKFTTKELMQNFTMPAANGNYIMKALLLNPPKKTLYPIASKWDVRVLNAVVSNKFTNTLVYVPSDEKELLSFLESMQIKHTTNLNDSFKLILTSSNTWNKVKNKNDTLTTFMNDCLQKGISVIMLDAGDKYLGQGYPTVAGELGPLQGVMKMKNAITHTYKLFHGLSLACVNVAEPESHIQPAAENKILWNNIPDTYTRLWNGLRGGLIVPAVDIKFSGLDANAFTTQWKSRGANEKQILTGPYYGYELQGFYDFSSIANDESVIKKLKAKLKFLAEDAPALAMTIDTAAKVLQHDLYKEFKEASQGDVKAFTPLASCGKNLTRTPVSMVSFNSTKGKLIVSQLLTQGRLAKGFGGEGLYGIRYDEVARQLVLNMMNAVYE